MSRWWRAYDNAVDHPKLLKLSDPMHRAWFTLQCIASANGGTLPPTEDIATRLRLKPAKVAEWITRLVTAELMDNNDGIFSPHNWDSRQFKSDGSTERVKRFRDKKRNVSETLHATGPEAETEQNHSRADASAPIDEDLKRKASALAAGVSAHFIGRHQAVPNLDRCLLWLTQGYAPGTVLSAIETVLKRGKVISTLDYFDGAIKDLHAKAAPENLQIVPPGVFIVEGTLEWTCWDRHLRETRGRGSPVMDSKDENGRARRGWYHPTIVPDGYDEQTGERLGDVGEANVA